MTEPLLSIRALEVTFRTEQGEPFFAECDEPLPAVEPPFQCTPPERALRFEDFR